MSPPSERVTAIRVQYFDAEDNYIQKTVVVGDPRTTTLYGYCEKTIAATGCTSREQALRVGKTHLKMILEGVI